MNWKTVFNPFERFDEKLLLLVGIIAIALSIAIGYWTNTAFTSIYKISAIENHSLQTIVISTLLSFLFAILVLFILGKILNGKTRIIDIINTVLISQLVLLPMQCFGNASSIRLAGKSIIKYESNPTETFPFLDFLTMISMTSISITILIYSFTIFYNGFKTATISKNGSILYSFVQYQ